MKHGAVYDDRAPELFSDREHRALGAPPRPNRHGVYLEPDETLELWEGKNRRCCPLGEVRLLQLDGRGWVWATSFSLPLGGCSSPLTLGFRRPQVAPTRRMALEAARDLLTDQLASYVRMHKPTTLTRRLAAWIAKLPEAQP